MGSSFELFRDTFFQNAAIFKKSFQEMQSEFGASWEEEFDAHLENLFGLDETSYQRAVEGYSRFAVDAMRLQRRFNREKKYADVSYAEAVEQVYLNEDYMLGLYLPGILVSHFLWRHHYRQLLFYKEKFLPLLDTLSDKRFYEVGTGTGFYTIQIFRHDSAFEGIGIDISPHSRSFTQNNLRGWGFDGAFRGLDLDIVGAELEPLPCIQTIEVLEHLEDPQLFLNHLRKLLRPDGYGFITAALTAPNADHIYLYWTPDEVVQQLETAGFTVRDQVEEEAYEGAPGEIVPKVAAFIVS